MHVIGRYVADIAWPGPVWNAGVVEDPDLDVVVQRVTVLRDALEI